MRKRWERARILITVMTYPHPSRKYRETVCTAGITEDYKWVRLYPIDYRCLKPHQRFRKYQWIEAELTPTEAGHDCRRESRRVRTETLRPLGNPLPTRDAWAARRAVIDRLPVHTVRELETMYELEKISLGVVRPAQVLDIEVKESDPEWDPKYRHVFDQLSLFDTAAPRLRKLPREFRYVFRCEDDREPRRAVIIDWELGVLFLKEWDKLKCPDRAAEKVKRKYLNELCAPDRDTVFFMGTRWPYNTWMVLGVFWPPKQPQQHLSLE